MNYVKYLSRFKCSFFLLGLFSFSNIANANILDNLYNQKSFNCNDIIQDRVKKIRILQRSEQSQAFYVPNKNYILNESDIVCKNKMENVCGLSTSGGTIQCVRASCPGSPVGFHLKDYKTSCAACRNSRINAIFSIPCDQVERKK